MRILIVEDEKSLRTLLERRFTGEKYTVDACGDGREALSYIETGTYDCIILDIMLPGMDGLSVLREMRDRRHRTPVLLLTARDSIVDRVKGLDIGADDYLTKPFSYDELSARVRAMLRRGGEEKTTTLSLADLSMDTLTRTVTRGGKEIELTSKEFALLEYFLRHPGQVFTREQIISHIWNFDFDNDSNIVDVYVRYLRRKIDDDSATPLIHTIRGTGYTLREKL